MSTGSKVLIIVENQPVPPDVRVWQESTALREAGYEVSVICPKGKGFTAAYEELDGIHIYRHPLSVEGNSPLGYLREYAVAFVWELLLSLRAWRRHGIDVIHMCNPPEDMFLIGLLYKVFGKKLVFDHHDLSPELYVTKFGRKDIFYRILLLLERLTFLFSDMCLATNESYRQIAITRGRKDPGCVRIVPNGPDLHRLQLRAPLPELKEGRRYMLGYLGVIAQQEGLDLLFEAVKYLVVERRFTEMLLVVMGDGPGLSKAKQMVMKLRIEDYVHFTGWVTGDKMLNYLNTCDVCVAPDRYSEMNDKSTMVKILEYMAVGKPVVLFDLTEGRNVAQKAGLYARRDDPIDFAEKILELLQDETKRKQMGEFGRRRILEELCWDKAKVKLVEAYQELLKTDRKRGRKRYL